MNLQPKPCTGHVEVSETCGEPSKPIKSTLGRIFAKGGTGIVRAYREHGHRLQEIAARYRLTQPV